MWNSTRIAILSFAVALLPAAAATAQCTWGGTTSLFTNCSVGINTSTPAFPLEVVRDGGNIQLTGTAYAVSGGAVNVLGRGARGSMGAPEGTQANDFMMVMGGRGYVGGSGFSTQNSSRIAFRAGSTFTGTSQGGYITFDTVDGADTARALLARMTIGQDGNVGVGTAPASGVRLSVSGNVNVVGSLTATSVINAVYGQDIAEWVGTTQTIAPGTVVVLDPDRNNEVLPSKHAYDTAVAGVVSARAGIVLGQGGGDKVAVATYGRVPVRVDATAHPIKIGDLLVTSHATGMAMYSEAIDLGGARLHRPGTILGKALEPLERGQGTILVLLSLQ